MTIFAFRDDEALGRVVSVDTAVVVLRVDDVDRLRQLQVNRLAVLQSSRPGQHLIGIIQKITRTSVERRDAEVDSSEDSDSSSGELNLVRIALIGTLHDQLGTRTNVFQRTLETVPEIDAYCFAVEGDRLTSFMRIVSSVAEDGPRLSLGRYTVDDRAEAFLNGNKFFQRHAVIVGSTGSGKSWTTARVLEQVAMLPCANAILFDIHGEYRPLEGPGIAHMRVAGPADLSASAKLSDGVLFLPYWLLGYEALIALLVDRSDQNAPNQAMVMSRAIVDAKQANLAAQGRNDVLENFTIDSPIPFSIQDVLGELNRVNNEMVAGARGEKQGDMFGRLSRLIQRLEGKMSDRRLGFMFGGGQDSLRYEWLSEFANALIGNSSQHGSSGGVKIIDFSEVPSDVLPVIVSLVARVCFSLQQWMPPTQRHPVALFCDEAHLYIPDRSESGGGDVSVQIFERIAKEGRKYGLGLVVISQRPSEVNRTVLSQCNNVVTMRLTNGDDQGVIRRLLPDSLGGFGDLLPVLDTGEALVVGDASLLPSRVRVSQPRQLPNSGTVDFWDEWARDSRETMIPAAVDGWRKQSVQPV